MDARVATAPVEHHAGNFLDRLKTFLAAALVVAVVINFAPLPTAWVVGFDDINLQAIPAWVDEYAKPASIALLAIALSFAFRDRRN